MEGHGEVMERSWRGHGKVTESALFILLELLEIGRKRRPVLRVLFGPDVHRARAAANGEDGARRVARKSERAVLDL